MEITKARLKQIIMEEIQKFMVVDEEVSPEVIEPLTKELEDAAKEGDEDAAKKLAAAIQNATNSED